MPQRLSAANRAIIVMNTRKHDDNVTCKQPVVEGVTAVARAFVHRVLRVAALQFAMIFCIVNLGSATENRQILTGTTPGLLTHSQVQNLGAEDPSTKITVTVVLQQHDQATFQQHLQQLYTEGSPLYHQWLTSEQYAARFAPSAADAALVSDFLTSHHLTVTDIAQSNSYITAEGTVADVQNTFHVQINRFTLAGKTYRANINDAVIDGPAGAVIATVLGLDDIAHEPFVMRPVDPTPSDTAGPVAGDPAPTPFDEERIQIPIDKLTPHTFIAGCFGRDTRTFNTEVKHYPSYTYTGTKYGGNLVPVDPGMLNSFCAYTPGQVKAAYHLTDKDLQGNTAKGQSIGIVVAYGSPTLQADVTKFASYFGLVAPRLIIVGGPISTDPTWSFETTMDVEYASAMGQGAEIVLYVAKDQYSLFTTLFNAIANNCTAGNPCVNQISVSWGVLESLMSPKDLDFTENMLAQATSRGISVNVATGDCGDYNTGGSHYPHGGGCQSTGQVDVSTPASAFDSTAVGGTSLAMNSDNSVLFQTGWGTNFTQIATQSAFASFLTICCSSYAERPDHQRFTGGAGGGDSAYYFFPNESTCHEDTGNLGPGQHRFTIGGSVSICLGYPRQVPDIAFLADPQTGVQIIYTQGFDPAAAGKFVIGVGGGTSLSAPMFTGLWAVANQYHTNAGATKSRGSAAPYLYWAQQHYPTAITDIQDKTFSNMLPNNVTGCEYTLSGFPPRCIPFSASDLASPLYGTTSFVSALVASSKGSASHPVNPSWYVMTFGTNSSLRTTPGWDNVTGLGVPNGSNFIKGTDVYAPVCLNPVTC